MNFEAAGPAYTQSTRRLDSVRLKKQTSGGLFVSTFLQLPVHDRLMPDNVRACMQGFPKSGDGHLPVEQAKSNTSRGLRFPACSVQL